MAVIESKGDGFALYNGVKLRNIDTVWDKNIYSHVVVSQLSNGTYRAYFCQQPVILDYNNEEFVVFAPYVHYKLEDNGWVLSNSKDEGQVTMAYDRGVVWTNHDIINTSDNTVYLAASEPISLDGMNVIEWDGDTTGLEVTQNYYYFVSPATNIDVSRQCVVRNTRSNGAFQVKQVIPTGSDGYYLVAQDARCVTAASEGNPTTGIALGSRTTTYVSLFAYYPIAEEQPEIDRGTLFILYRMFSPVVFHALTGKNHWSD